MTHAPERIWVDEELHHIAREVAANLTDVDKKQLRFNEIVDCAKGFYPAAVSRGVEELVESCCRTSVLYVNKNPMWHELNHQYGWMR